MNRKTKIILIGLFVGLCIAGLCLACLWGVDKVLPELSIFLRVNPIGPDEFPDTDIVFQTFPLGDEVMNDPLGFINADGSGLTYLTFDVFRQGHFGGPWSPSFPMMTGDNSTLIFMAKTAIGYSGDLFIVHAGQKAVECAEEYREGLMRPSLTADQTQILADFIPKPTSLALLDLDTCHLESITPTIYDSSILEHESESTQGALSPDGRLLAYVEIDSITGWPYEPPIIYIHNLDTGEEVHIGEGLGPAWSPDGQWLAYTGSDGIYVVRADGTENQQVVAYINPLDGNESAVDQTSQSYWAPLPSWSPDGQRLVYHKCIVPVEKGNDCSDEEDYAIFIVNLATGEETLLIEGGLNPYWRWP